MNAAAHTLDVAKLEAGFKSIRSRLKMLAFMGTKMPMGMIAGLRVKAIDLDSCTVSLPGGRRTQNPFGSTYWAAQGMAAEMATGVHGYVLTHSAPVPVRMILAGCEGEFTRMCKGPSTYVFSQGTTVREAIETTLRTGESLTCATEVIGYDGAGEQISKWTFTWSFRAKL
jgi:hypothetical protein